MSLNFPSKLKIGFQKREDTYNGNLAFITYYNVDNTVKNEKSFTGWCNNKIPTVEYENKPQSGYVLNKGIKHYGHFGNSQKIRIFDPRGFEFEISVDNLVELTQYSDINSQEIIQECVLAWNNNQVYLVPTNSLNYKELQAIPKSNPEDVKAFDKKDKLVPGNTYATKSMPYLYYIGNFNKNDIFFTSDKYFKVVRKSSIVVQLSEEKKSNHDELSRILTFLNKLCLGGRVLKKIKDEYKNVYVDKLMSLIDNNIIKVKKNIIDSDDISYKQRLITMRLYDGLYELYYIYMNNTEVYNYNDNSEAIKSLVKVLSLEHTEEELDNARNELIKELLSQDIYLSISNFENGYGMLTQRLSYHNIELERLLIDVESLEDLLENQENYVREEVFVGH